MHWSLGNFLIIFSYYNVIFRYVGQLSREQSDALLNARGIEGDFLVRDSESNVNYLYN